ncbi:hypothetical protein [Streptomyces sp. NPDC057695]|uniref:hypothetical protein n=1 Tax=Streptomyces sp. NPDC057695 TaxID=3346217 RepID=UPI00368F5FD3
MAYLIMEMSRGRPQAAGKGWAGGVRVDGLPAALSDRVRVAAVKATGLLDTAGEEVFDDLASLATRITGTGRALVTLVDADRSFWKACVGVDAVGRLVWEAWGGACSRSGQLPRTTSGRTPTWPRCCHFADCDIRRRVG